MSEKLRHTPVLFFLYSSASVPRVPTRSIFSSWKLVLLLICESTTAIVGVSDNNHVLWLAYLHPLIVTLGNVGWMGMVVYWIVIMCSITCAISKSQVKKISHVIRGFIIRTSLLPKIVSFYFHFEKIIISIDQIIVHVWLQHMWSVCGNTFICLSKIHNSMIVDYLYF